MSVSLSVILCRWIRKRSFSMQCAGRPRGREFRFFPLSCLDGKDNSSWNQLSRHPQGSFNCISETYPAARALNDNHSWKLILPWVDSEKKWPKLWFALDECDVGVSRRTEAERGVIMSGMFSTWTTGKEGRMKIERKKQKILTNQKEKKYTCW